MKVLSKMALMSELLTAKIKGTKYFALLVSVPGTDGTEVNLFGNDVFEEKIMLFENVFDENLFDIMCKEHFVCSYIATNDINDIIKEFEKN